METLRTQDLDIWIKCRVLFRTETDGNLAELYEELKIDDNTEWCDFAFRLSELESYNEYQGTVEIRLKSGFTAISDIDYNDFDKILFGNGSDNIN